MMFVGIDFPKLLDTNTVRLRTDAIAEIVFFEQRLSERAMATFREYRLSRMKLETWLVIRHLFAVLADPHVAGGNPLHLAVLFVEHFGRQEAG